MGRTDFSVDPRRLWRMLQVNGYRELAVTSEHTIEVNDLPPCTKTHSTASSWHKREWKDCCC